MKFNSTNLKINLKGIGISLMNLISQEIFYISLYKINFEQSYNIFRAYTSIKESQLLLFKIYNIQVDYCLESYKSYKKTENYKNNFLNLFVPKTQFIPYNEINIIDEDFFPFFHVSLKIDNYFNLDNNSKTKKLTEIKYKLDDYELKLDQNILNSLLVLFDEYTNEIDLNKKLKIQEQGSELEYLNKNRKKINCKKVIKKLNDRKNKTIELKNYEFYNDIYLNPKLISSDAILKEMDDNTIYYIENLIIFPVNFTINIKIDITSIEMKSLPIFFNKVLGFFGNSITNLSELPISFKKIEIKNFYNKLIRLQVN